MNKWYEFVKEYSRRDQLSFNYCLWMNPIKIQILDMYVFDNPYFKHDHHVLKKQYVYRIYQGNIDEFNFHNIIENTYEVINNEVNITFNIQRQCDIFYLILKDLNGLIIDSIFTKPKCDNFIYNNIFIKNKNYVINEPMISFNGRKFKIGDIINIRLKAEQLNNNNMVALANVLSKKIDKLSNNNKVIMKENNYLKQNLKDITESFDSLSDKYNNVINSKGWKILESLRKFKNK